MEMHQSCLRYGQSQPHLDARARPAQAQHRPILLSSNYRNPMPAKVLAKQPIVTQKLVHPQKAITSPRGTLLPREVSQVEDRAPRSPSSVSSMPSASMKARSGYHSPQEMHPEGIAGTVSRREAITLDPDRPDKISGSSPSHLTSTCSTSASSLPLGSLREKLRELLPKDLQQDTPERSKTVAEPNAGPAPAGVEEVQVELRREPTSREALEQKVLDLEARLNHALSSMSQVTEARNATDSATDAMLNALRRGVEEISDRCGTLEAQKENGTCTLERFRETEAKFNEMLRKMEVTLNSEDSCQDLVVAVKTLQSQFQVLQAEKRQVAEGLNAMGQKQHLIETMQLEIREKIQQVANQPVARLHQMESTLAQLQGQQRDLSASVQGLLNMYQACPEHVGSMDKVAVTALLQPIQQLQQQQTQELSDFKAMLEEMKGENSEAKAARREVATVADALSMLCTKVDELSASSDTADLGALSKNLAALTERVEQMEGKGHVMEAEKTAPTPSSASSSRGALPRVPSPRRWLQEPLFVSVGRRSEVPGILQSTNDQLLSRPSNSVLR